MIISRDIKLTKPRNKNNVIEKKRGFTLIELLVVIAIIALLSSVVMASLSTARMKSRDARRIADLNQIKIALEMYFDAKGHYPGLYRYLSTSCPTAPTTPCWDVAGLNSSAVSVEWDALASELSPYITKLPKDPINTPGCLNLAPNCYIYVYGRVGRTGTNSASSSISTTPNVYDLATNLEDPNNPNACKFKDYYGYNGSASAPAPYCSGGNSLYQVYDPSPN